MTAIEPSEDVAATVQDSDLPWEAARRERPAAVRRSSPPPVGRPAAPRASASPIPWTLALLTIVTMGIAAYQSVGTPSSHSMELAPAERELAAR